MIGKVFINYVFVVIVLAVPSARCRPHEPANSYVDVTAYGATKSGGSADHKWLNYVSASPNITHSHKPNQQNTSHGLSQKLVVHKIILPEIEKEEVKVEKSSKNLFSDVKNKEEEPKKPEYHDVELEKPETDNGHLIRGQQEDAEKDVAVEKAKYSDYDHQTTFKTYEDYNQELFYNDHEDNEVIAREDEDEEHEFSKTKHGVYDHDINFGKPYEEENDYADKDEKNSTIENAKQKNHDYSERISEDGDQNHKPLDKSKDNHYSEFQKHNQEENKGHAALGKAKPEYHEYSQGFETPYDEEDEKVISFEKAEHTDEDGENEKYTYNHHSENFLKNNAKEIVEQTAVVDDKNEDYQNSKKPETNYDDEYENNAALGKVELNGQNLTFDNNYKDGKLDNSPIEKAKLNYPQTREKSNLKHYGEHSTFGKTRHEDSDNNLKDEANYRDVDQEIATYKNAQQNIVVGGDKYEDYNNSMEPETVDDDYEKNVALGLENNSQSHTEEDGVFGKNKHDDGDDNMKDDTNYKLEDEKFTTFKELRQENHEHYKKFETDHKDEDEKDEKYKSTEHEENDHYQKFEKSHENESEEDETGKKANHKGNLYDRTLFKIYVDDEEENTADEKLTHRDYEYNQNFETDKSEQKEEENETAEKEKHIDHDYNPTFLKIYNEVDEENTTDEKAPYKNYELNQKLEEVNHDKVENNITVRIEKHEDEPDEKDITVKKGKHEGHHYDRTLFKIYVDDEEEDPADQKLTHEDYEHYQKSEIVKNEKDDGVKEKHEDDDHSQNLGNFPFNQSEKTATVKKVVDTHVDKLKKTTTFHGANHTDYDYYTYPKYSFRYSVDDPKTGDRKYQYENRDGDKVVGQYGFVESDGNLRLVDYKADDNSGFFALVTRGRL